MNLFFIFIIAFFYEEIIFVKRVILGIILFISTGMLIFSIIELSGNMLVFVMAVSIYGLARSAYGLLKTFGS